MTGKYLITTTEFFYAPDGKQYKAVWGEVKLIPTKDVLGMDPNRTSSNWTLQIGTDEEHILIGGCQINYSVKCDTEPVTSPVEQVFDGEKKVCVPAIYIPVDTKTLDPLENERSGTIWGFKSEEFFKDRLLNIIKILKFPPSMIISNLERDVSIGVFESFKITELNSDLINLELKFKDSDRNNINLKCKK